MCVWGEGEIRGERDFKRIGEKLFKQCLKHIATWWSNSFNHTHLYSSLYKLLRLHKKNLFNALNVHKHLLCYVDSIVK